MSGSTNYVGGMVFEVKDVQAEVDFWTKALGMRSGFAPSESGRRVAALAYGQTSLNADDGGKAAVEIRQAPEGAMGSVGNVLSYVAVTVPFGSSARVSDLRAADELVHGFGFFDMRSPGGIPVRGQVATRRDPLETIALNVRDVRDAEKALVKEFGLGGVETASTPCGVRPEIAARFARALPHQRHGNADRDITALARARSAQTRRRRAGRRRRRAAETPPPRPPLSTRRVQRPVPV